MGAQFDDAGHAARADPRGERVYLAVGRLIDGRAEFRHQRPVAHGADGKACHKNPPLALPGKTKNAA